MKKILRNILLVALITAFLFLLLEAGQRIRYAVRFKHTMWLSYGFMDKGKAGYVDVMDKHYRPERREFRLYAKYYRFGNLTYYKYNPKEYRGPVSVNGKKYTINSLGFRGQEFSLRKQEGIFRVVNMGASSTFGVDNDDEFTYSRLLENELNSNYGSNHFEVINAGIPSYTIKEIYALFKTEIIKLNPDLVTINSLCNDWILGRLSGRNLLVKLHMFLMDKSLFYTTLNEKISVLRSRGAGGAYRSDEKSLRVYRDYLTKIIKLAESRGIRIIIIKQPLNFLEKQQAYHAPFYAVIDEVSREFGIPVVAGGAEFDGPEKSGLFTDVVHLSDKGNQVLARLIYEKTSEFGWE